MEYRSGRCKGSLWMVLVVVLSGVSFASFADGKNQPTPTGTAEKKKQCVIVLEGRTVPSKPMGHCELALDDPAAKLVIKGWYRLVMPLVSYADASEPEDTADLKLWWDDLQQEASRRLGVVFLDTLAIGLMTIESEGGDSLSFPLWVEHPFTPTELDPAPGKTAKWDVKVVYSKPQLDQARKSLIQWAHDWKRYRGDEFGYYNGEKLPERIHLDGCSKEAQQQAGGNCRSVLRKTSKDFSQEDLTIGGVQGCPQCREVIRRAKKAREFYAFVKDSWNVEQLKESISKAKLLLPPGLTRSDVEEGGSEHLEENIGTRNQQHKEQNALLTKIILWQDALDRIEQAGKEMENSATKAKDCIEKHCKTASAKQAKASRPKLVLPGPHDLMATAHRAKKQVETGGKSGAAKQPEDITVGGGSGPRQTPEKSAAVLPGYKPAAECNFPPPQIVGEGKPGLEGLPNNFPLPPDVKTPWNFDVTSGSLYGMGVFASQLDTVDFLKQALPANGWSIYQETRTPNPFTNTDSMHLLFRNKDYCGWASISVTVPNMPTPTALNIGFNQRQ